jgi:hypothetical protein
MERAAFEEEMDARLRDVEDYLRAMTFPAPSTLAKSEQQERERPIVEELRVVTAAARARLDALRASTDSVWEPARNQLEQQWTEISALLKKLRR